MTSLRSSLQILPPLLLLFLLGSCGGAARSTEGAGIGVGYVNIVERVSPPPHSLLTVEMVDSLLVDSVAMEERVIGRQVLELMNSQMPVEFVVRYDPARVDTNARHYLYLAHITHPDGTLIFHNIRPYTSVVPGRPDTLEIILHRKYDDE